MAKFLSKKEVAKMLGVGLVSLWRWERAGNFPARVKIGQRRVAFHEQEILDWMQSRQAVGGKQ